MRRHSPSSSCRRSFPAAATRSARTTAATSSSTARSRAGGIARSGSTTARGGSADCGSTNGIRVESRTSVLGRAASASVGADAQGARDRAGCPHRALGARAASRAEYPRVLAAAVATATASTPPSARDAHDAGHADRGAATRRAPSSRSRRSMASGVQTRRLGHTTAAVPRRSLARQALVVDWAHEGVSGHHVDIVELDEDGARVDVHGDNGVTVDGVTHPPGRSSAGSRRDADARTRVARRAGMHADAVARRMTSLITPANPTLVAARARTAPPTRRDASNAAFAREAVTAMRARSRGRVVRAARQHRSQRRQRTARSTAWRRCIVVADGVGGGPWRRGRAAARGSRASRARAAHASTTTPCARRCSMPIARSPRASPAQRRLRRGDGRAVRRQRTRCSRVAGRVGRRLPRLSVLARRRQRRRELITRDDTYRHLGETPPPGGSPTIRRA